MSDKIIILSDIHANLTALSAVLADADAKYRPDAYILLGDLVNYGMRPNEVIERVCSLSPPILASLTGNHEKAITDGDVSRFSTERGKRLLQYTRSRLTAASMAYITGMDGPRRELEIAGKRILLLHGNETDPYWGKLTAENAANTCYAGFDYVLSGHTHQPHYLEIYFPVDCPSLRNRKKTVFVNPGSVGQPRNRNPRAQYVYFEPESETVHFNAVAYDVASEQALYSEDIDSFYKNRLILGI